MNDHQSVPFRMPRSARGVFNNQLQTGPLLPRLAWIMCFTETGNAQAVCEKFGISKKTFYKWFKRYQSANGNAMSLLDQSRRPHHSPRATPESAVKILMEAKMQTGFGQRRLKSYLEEKHKISLSERTIWKILKNQTGGTGSISL